MLFGSSNVTWLVIDDDCTVLYNSKLNVKNDIVLKRQRCMSAKL
jgi:hypothetical protein